MSGPETAALQELERVLRDAVAFFLRVTAERVAVSLASEPRGEKGGLRIDVLVDGEASPRGEEFAAELLTIGAALARRMTVNPLETR